MKISAVINTYNEEQNIRRCLESIVTQVDEIVVVDMESTDATVRICQEYGCQIISIPPRYKDSGQRVGGVTPVDRQLGVDRASFEWIFIIDADETAPASLFSELRRIAATDDAQICAIPRINTFFGINFTGRGFPPERIERFFRRGTIDFEDHPHRWGVLKGKRIELPYRDEFSFMHYGTQSVRDWIAKANSYTDFEAHSLVERGARPGIRSLLLRPAKVFFTHYVSFGGWKAGFPGVVFSALWACYWLIAAAKMWQNSIVSLSNRSE